VNLLVARLLRRGGNSLNLRAAFLHVLGDLLGSLAAIASGALILTTGWLAADPILSLFICALILVSAFRVLKEGTGILLEGVPAHLDLEEVGRAIVSVSGVHSVHDLHLWQLSSREAALSAHVVLREPREWEETIGRVRALLAERFGVHHATLEPSRVPEVSAEP
jgi:cobalt-zinc-cadmium efflux system protein